MKSEFPEEFKERYEVLRKADLLADNIVALWLTIGNTHRDYVIKKEGQPDKPTNQWKGYV
eukprot:CAMPEP_0170484052 /NCGR_PEP_ID=MMETSP0208-20121228/3608_1 /TAXON_ID=197538 /ORGANISM="Strombidium inclinatum, Strain S3" /LENGTH=59 /DNA_ID=CAMNT_0010757297 /DNA_START=176 /DNA_END=355 /DNA_ORIENTATION=+